MNHRKRGCGEAIIKITAVIFFSRNRCLLGDVQCCRCLHTTAMGSQTDRTGTESAAFVGHAWDMKTAADAICTIPSIEHLLNTAGLQPWKCHRGKIP